MLNAPSQALINNEIAEITHKIETLDAMRAKLEQDLLKLQEDELELDDERGYPQVTSVHRFHPHIPQSKA